jgi:hypothetical protein
MPVGVYIKGGSRIERDAHVTENNSVQVAIMPPDVPNVGASNRYRYLSGKLGTSGLDSGTLNQNVNGATNAVDFYVGAAEDYDIHILGIALVVADTAVVHNRWGNVAALTTGFDIKVRENNVFTFVIEKAKTSGQAIAQSGFFNPYGNGATSFEITNWTANDDATTVYIPIGDFVPDGLRLGRGTLDSLTATINDDLTGLTEQFVRVFGYRHYPV